MKRRSAYSPARITVPHDVIAEFSRRNHIRRLAVFGSALRDDFRPDSDLDILVEFEPDTRIGLRFFSLERELTELLGRPVDLNTPGFLSPHFRAEVIAEAEDLYVAT
jgi:predicted nucleotidyltransferase